MKNIEQFLRNKHFVYPSSQIYGGVSGLFDYAPHGLTLKNEMLRIWRQQFVDQELIYEIDTCCLLPYEVLKTSGHVDKFCDILVFDEVNGDFYRADHIIKERLEAELKKREKKKSRINENKIELENEKISLGNNRTAIQPNSEYKNNLEIKSGSGCKNGLENKKSSENCEEEIIEILKTIDCVTPERAKEIIEKYSLKSYNGNSLVGATRFNLIFGTQIGPKKNSVAYLRPETAQGQFMNFKRIYEIAKKLPFGTASVGRVFRNEISPRNGLLRVREFEQAEIEFFTFFDEKFKFKKFREVENIKIKILDSKDENKELNLREAVDNKIIDNETLAFYIGKTFIFLRTVGVDMERVRFRQHKKDEMAHYAVDCWDAEILTSYGWIECVGIADRSDYDLRSHAAATKTNLAVLREDKKYEIPVVIEPSFGVGRIFYAVCEHCFYIRSDNRNVMRLNFNISPVQIEVSSILTTDEFSEMTNEVYQSIKNSFRVVYNQRKISIGKKYSCADEIGTPYYVIVDHSSLLTRTVTVRDRDSMEQERIRIEDLNGFFNLKLGM